MSTERIVAAGLLTERDMERLGEQFQRFLPVPVDPRFTNLIAAIAEADRALAAKQQTDRQSKRGRLCGAMTTVGPEQTLSDLRASIHRTPIATIITDNLAADNPIIEANDPFLELTGYSRGEVLGRNCRFLGGFGTEPEARTALRDAIRQGRPTIVELTNYRKDGRAFRNAVMLAPIMDENGCVSMFIGSQMDVGHGGTGAGLRRTRARDLVAKLTPRLRQTLDLMSMGYRNKQIAGHLGIEESTVKMHRSRLLEALGAKTSADAVRIAVEAGLATSDRD